MKFIFLINVFYSFLLSAQSFNFVAVGDTGTGDENQYRVAKAIENTCYNEKCDFVILLGDNFYGEGVTSVDDPQFKEKFELPYQNIQAPFYAILGNHDYGKFAFDWDRGQNQIDYSMVNTKWVMPSFFYDWNIAHTQFIALDTSRLFWGKDVKNQREFIRTALTKNFNWRIALGHHPYISNSTHGNAGAYDGVFIRPASGYYVKKIIENELCGKIDLYLGGHDHNLQVLKPTPKCPNPFIVSGSGGAKVNQKLKEDRNAYYFQKAVSGFHFIRVSEDEMIIETRNDTSQIEHVLKLSKKRNILN